MLMDNEGKLVELFMDNVIWGNIVIDINNWTGDKKSIFSTGELFGDWIRTRRISKKLSDHQISKLYDFFTMGRFVNAVNGKLQDREYDLQNKILVNENNSLKVRNQELEIDLSEMVRELKDKTDLVEEYETTLGVRKK